MPPRAFSQLGARRERHWRRRATGEKQTPDIITHLADYGHFKRAAFRASCRLGI